MSLSKNTYCDGVDCCVLHVDGKWREVNMNCYLFRCSECWWEKMVKSYCFDGISRYLCTSCSERLSKRRGRRRNINKTKSAHVTFILEADKDKFIQEWIVQSCHQTWPSFTPSCFFAKETVCSSSSSVSSKPCPCPDTMDLAEQRESARDVEFFPSQVE